MGNETNLSPEPIMRISTGPWANAILASAVEHHSFAHMEAGSLTVDGLASKAGISRRGAQALLDGLLGLGLVEKDGDGYRNAPIASQFLVEGKPSFIGGLSRVNLAEGPRRGLPPGGGRTGAPPL